MTKNELIQDIVRREWAMFQRVENEGGRASCQDDRQTFFIMRESQWLSWDEAPLASYLHDLREAEALGRNLLAEKYGYMMAATAPEAFAKIAHRLPLPTGEKAALIDQICESHLRWNRFCAEHYPHLAAGGRSVDEDSPWATSSQTYLRGELSSYSTETLRLYWDQIGRAEEEGRNLCEETLNNTVKAYGYASAADYEARWKGAGL